MKAIFARRILCVLTGIACLVFASCVDLAHVHHYALISENEMGRVIGAGYDFKQACEDRCQMNAMRNFDIQRGDQCDCKLFTEADQSMRKIERSVRKYFAGLKNLSDDALTNYKVDPVADAIKEGQYGTVTIEKKQVQAYASIAKVLLKASTDAYRRNKIKEYIIEANAPLQDLMEKLVFILRNNLATELDFRKESLYAYYMELKQSKNLSDYEKGKAVNDYFAGIDDATRKKTRILNYAKAVEKIATAHDELYKNRDKLTEQMFRSLLSEYTNNVEEIMESVDDLK